MPLYIGGDGFVAKVNAAGSALVYSTYLGGSGADQANTIAVDAVGNAYVAGQTTSADFPIRNALQPTLGGGFSDAFVTKINAAGSALVYSTYLGGSLGDHANAIAVDGAGNAYVTGQTLSADFPTRNALQPIFVGGSDAFVTKMNAAGSALLYSTYLRGAFDDEGQGIAVDSAGNAYVTATSDLFDALVTMINPAGVLVNSTQVVGAHATGIAVDAMGTAYVTGTASPNQSRRTVDSFPRTVFAFQQQRKTFTVHAFVTKIAQQTFVSLSPAKLAFPRQLLGTTSAAKTVTVTNQGSGTLTINKIFLGGLHPGDFAQTNTCGSTLATDATCTISVTFTPTKKGNSIAAAGISDSDPATPQPIPLSAVATVVSLSTSKLSFGSQPVGTASASQNITVTNVGSVALPIDIGIIGKSPADFSQLNTCGASIAAHGSCTITVTFKPTVAGARPATVSISDDGGGSPQSVILSGKGT